MQSKNILFISYHFPPEISPRSYRAYELVKYLQKNYSIDLITNKAVTAEFRADLENVNFIINNSRPASHSSPVSSPTTTQLKKTQFLRKILYFFVPGGLSTLSCLKYLLHTKKLKKKYDCIISIGLPIGSHVVAYILKKFFKITDNIILDYGDPFYKNPNMPYSPFNYLLEKMIINDADSVVVPVENAISAFLGLDVKNKIHVIPQGLDLEKIEIDSYHKNTPCKIGFAGVFYKNLRDPENFMCWALNLPEDFKFHIYTNLKSAENRELINKYKSFDKNNHLIVNDLIPRQDCIRFLSTCDFVINFENISSTQNPSKLIDYMLSRRPILSISTTETSWPLFSSFLNNNFEKAHTLPDFDQYSMKSVGLKFEKLISKNPHSS